MLTLDYGTVKDPEFVASFKKIASYPGFKKFETLKRIYKLGKALDKALTEVGDLHTALVKKYALLDEAGNLVPFNNSPGTYQIREDVVDGWRTEATAFEDEELSLDALPIQAECLEGCPLNSSDLMNLAPILTNLD